MHTGTDFAQKRSALNVTNLVDGDDLHLCWHTHHKPLPAHLQHSCSTPDLTTLALEIRQH